MSGILDDVPAHIRLQHLVNEAIPFDEAIARLAEFTAGGVAAPIQSIALRYAEIDAKSIELWFANVDATMRWPEWPIRSWIVSIQIAIEDDPLEVCHLTICGVDTCSPLEIHEDTEAILPPEYDSRETGLDALYQALQQVEDYETRNDLEYIHGIGYAALLVKRVLERRQWEMFRGRRVAVIWAGGDGVVVPKHLTNYGGSAA